MNRKTVSYWVGGVITLLSILVSCSDDKEKRVVVCWGDSLTASHVNGQGVKAAVKGLVFGDNSYPSVLQKLLGSDYEVVNCGVGGENTLAIMARQGAYPMALVHDVIVPPDSVRKLDIFIGSKDVPAFVSTYDNKTPVLPLLQGGYGENTCARVNPAEIDGMAVTLASECHIWQNSDKSYGAEFNYFLSPKTVVPRADTLRKGSVVRTQAMRSLRDKWCAVFFVGQNGGFADASQLVEQLKAMIAYSRCKNYVVVSFHKPNDVMPTAERMAGMEDTLQHTFGPHFVNLRLHMVTRGLAEAGMTPTQEDEDSISRGKVPPQLMVDGCHFTKEGYRIIAQLVRRKIDSFE